MSEFTQSSAADGRGRGVSSHQGARQSTPDGVLELGTDARLFPLEPLPGQPRDRLYAYVDQGLPMPAEGVAYVVTVEGGSQALAAREQAAVPSARGLFSSLRRRPAAREEEPVRVRMAGYLDEFARGFAADAPLAMSPARHADVRLLEGGTVRLSSPDGDREWDVARFRDADGAVTFSDSRVNLGAERGPMPRVRAAAVALVAYCLLPREQGVDMAMLGAADVLAELDGTDLFSDVRRVLAVIARADSHPLLNPPGILTYLSRLLCDTGIDRATPSSIAAAVHLSKDMAWTAAGVGEDEQGAGVSLGAGAFPTAGASEDVAAKAPDIADPAGAAAGEEGSEAAADAEATTVPDADAAPDAAADAPDAGGPSEDDDSSTGDVPAWRADVPGLVELAEGSGIFLSAVPAEQPEVTLMRTTDYADLFYVVFRPDQVSDDGRRMLLETESVLNRFLLMARALSDAGALDSATQGQCVELDRWLCENVLQDASDAALDLVGDALGEEPARPRAARARVGAGAGADSGSGGATGDAGEAPDTDMEVRIAFAQACERLALPARMEYRFRFDSASDHLYVDFSAPDITLLPKRDLSTEQRMAAEARYAAHLVQLMAATAFGASRRVRVVTANAWRSSRPSDSPVAQHEGGRACSLSASFERDRFIHSLASQAGLAQAHAPLYSREPFGFMASFTHAYTMGDDNCLSGTRPLASLNSVVQAYHRTGAPQERDELGEMLLGVFSPEALAHAESQAPDALSSSVSFPPASRETPDLLVPHDSLERRVVETDPRLLDESGSRLLLADRVRDMSIYEDTPRAALFEEVVGALRVGGPTRALGTLRDIHDRTENFLVRNACNVVSEQILGDRVTENDTDLAKRAFSDVYGLQGELRAALSRARRQPAEAVDMLESLVGRVDAAGWFADSPSRAYRYFDSYASRALYASRFADDLDGRELRLVADEVFLAHHRVATLLMNSTTQAERAIEHARRAVELGPSVASAHLCLARGYFSAFDYLSEIETLKRMMRVAWNPADVGMALYWMGYAYWMTDQPELGTACYQRCASFDRSLADPMAAELLSFVRKRGEAAGVPVTAVESALLADDQVDQVLRDGGVDIDAPVENARFLVRAADAALRAGSQRLTLNLLGSATAMLRDDALSPVLESLSS